MDISKDSTVEIVNIGEGYIVRHSCGGDITDSKAFTIDQDVEVLQQVNRWLGMMSNFSRAEELLELERK